MKKPVLYYAASKYLMRGKIYRVKKTADFPEYIALHIDDLKEVSKKLSEYKLVPLKDHETIKPIR